MSKINSRSDLKDINQPVYRWLLANRPYLLDRLLPFTRGSTDTKRKILEFIEKNKRRPNKHKPEEQKLAGAMFRYSCPSVKTFDLEFRKQLEAICPTKPRKSIESKRKILEFIKINKRSPKQSPIDLEEKRMALRLSSYCNPNSELFDSNFKQQLEDLISSLRKELT